VVEVVQGCRLGACAGASTAELSLPDHCLWVTVPPQAHLISIGSTKTMDDTIQFEGGGDLPNLDSIGGRVASAIAEPTLRLGEAVIATMSNVARTMQNAYQDTK
jgi:hypothetical protein